MNFRINLDSNIADKSKADAAAMEQTQKALDAESRALSVMEKQMKALQAASVVDIALFKKLDTAIKSKKDSVSSLTAKMVDYGDRGVEAVTKKQMLMSESLGGLAARAGPFGAFLQKIGPWGLVAAAAIGGITIAVAAAVVGITKLISLGSQMSEQRGDTVRSMETFFKSEKAAEHTYDMVVDVTRRVAISRDRAVEVADSLMRNGVKSGDAMVRAVESIGKAEAARKGAAAVVENIIARSEKARANGWGGEGMGGFSVSRDELRASGITMADLAQTLAKQTGNGMQDMANALYTGRVSVAAGLDALNATIDEKLGPIADKKFYTIGAALTRMRDRFSDLFDNMDTAPLARAMDTVGRMFDTTSVTGYALQEVLKGVFRTVGEWVEKAMPYVQTFADGLILAGLKIYNGLYPLRQQLAKIFGDGAGSVEDLEGVMLKFGDVVGGVAEFIATNAIPLAVAAIWLLSPAIWSAVTAAGALAVSVVAATWPFLAVGAAVYGFAKMLSWTWETAANIDWSYIGEKIKEAFRAAFSWVTDTAGKVWAKLKGIFGGGGSAANAEGIAGFSSGGYTGDGGTGDVAGVVHGQEYVMPADATRRIGRENLDAMRSGRPVSPTTTASQITNNQSTSSTNAPQVTFSEGAIQINGVGNAEQLRSMLPQVMADVFEQLGISMGASTA